MATNKRSFPNDYFAWYNDDTRLAIVNKITSTDNDEGFVSGEYDTYSDSTINILDIVAMVNLILGN